MQRTRGGSSSRREEEEEGQGRCGTIPNGPNGHKFKVKTPTAVIQEEGARRGRRGKARTAGGNGDRGEQCDRKNTHISINPTASARTGRAERERERERREGKRTGRRRNDN